MNKNSLLNLALVWADVNDVRPPLDVLLKIGELDGFKSFDFFLRTMQRLVKSLYENNIASDVFIGIALSLIGRQLMRAFEGVWLDDGNEGPMPSYLQTSADALIETQKAFLPQYAKDIIDARVDNTPMEPLIARTQLWVTRYTEAENEGRLLIKLHTGGNLEWVEGDTSEKCKKCLALNGIVASAKVWAELGVHPQDGPNYFLANNSGEPNGGCEGWECKCELRPTDKRQSTNARQRIIEIVSA